MSKVDVGEGQELTRRDFLKHSAGSVAAASLGASALGCHGSSAGGGGTPLASQPISATVLTTLDQTVHFAPASGLAMTQLADIADYDTHGYGVTTVGPGLPLDPRLDLMPAGYAAPTAPRLATLLSFFAITDIHITDKESPAQLIYLQQLNASNAKVTSIYSPIMMYTTQVLDAAIQTVNALHKVTPFDFGISLGDACNSTQYNETRWYIDVMDGLAIIPSSGAHDGSGTIDYQKPYKATGLDKSIPWYQTMGNHDHLWMGSVPSNAFLHSASIGNAILAAGDVLAYTVTATSYVHPDTTLIGSPVYYMGVLDGSTPNGEIRGAGPVANFSSPPMVVADRNRRLLDRASWISEFYNTTSQPAGHGFGLVVSQEGSGFACYSFLPKAGVPLKVIVLDDTQSETDGSTDIHGHGFLDQARYDWLLDELQTGQASNQLMIIAAHIPIAVAPHYSEVEWWVDPQNAVTLPQLIASLQTFPNLILWVAGHRHVNAIKGFYAPDPVNHPEKGFWQVETSSLRDFPQQFRTFEIILNADYTVSIAAVNVDPAVQPGTPAAKSRYYAVAVEQICKTVVSAPSYRSDPTLPGYADPTVPDPTIQWPDGFGSYNAQLYKQLTPTMIGVLQGLYPSL